MTAELRFDGQVAVVTGAGRGLGREHALLLGARGAAVVVNDLGGDIGGCDPSRQPADEVVDEIRSAGGQAVASYASVADDADAQSIVDTAIDSFGRIDIVVNNAGIFLTPVPFAEKTLANFRSMMDVHFFGTVNVCKAAWPHMQAAGYGRIVNTISEAALGYPGQSDYGAAKGAVFGLTRNLAGDGRAAGILANCIAPRGATRAPQETMPDEFFEQFAAIAPPRENSPGVAYLCHESCTLTGEIIQVGAGSISRITFLTSAGWETSDPTLEGVAANLDTIMDMTGAVDSTSALVMPPE